MPPVQKPSERIRKLMEISGLSQELLAKKLGITQASVSKWLNDVTQPRGGHLLLLAEIFEVTPEYILDGVEIKTQTKTKDEKDRIIDLQERMIKMLTEEVERLKQEKD